LELVHRGARVLGVARSADKLHNLADELGESFHPFPLDLTQKQDLDALIEDLNRSAVLPDILINNAGVGSFEHLEDLAVAEWDRMMNLNLRVPFLLMKAVIPHMKKQKRGTILNLNSVAGRQPFRNAAAYCASKYGLRGLTDVAREELRKFNIRVVGIHPGAIGSSWWEKIEDSEHLPYDRMLQVEDVVVSILHVLELSEKATTEEIVLRYVGGNF